MSMKASARPSSQEYLPESKRSFSEIAFRLSLPHPVPVRGAFAMSSIVGRDATGPSRCRDKSIVDGRTKCMSFVAVHSRWIDDSDSSMTCSKPLIRRVRSAGVKTVSVVVIL